MLECIERKEITNAKKIGNYSITISYKCNWNCKYCIVDTHNRKEPDFEIIKEKIESIVPGSFVSITGGEPGLVSSDKLRYVFNKLKLKKCFIHVITNGEFFKLKEFINDVDQFAWHCTENLEDKLILPDIPYNKIEFMLVVTNESYNRLENYIGKYPVIFNIRGADTNGKGGDFLSIKNGIYIFNKYKDKLTITSLMGLLTRFSCYEKIEML